MKKIIACLLLLTVAMSCGKIEKRIVGSWFVVYHVNDTPTTDFVMTFNEDGKGTTDGVTNFAWEASNKTLSITNDGEDKPTEWENTRNKKNIQFYTTTDSTGTIFRMEMERI